MEITKLSTLQIHKLTKEQYKKEVEAGRIDPTALYLTEDEEIDLSEYAKKEDLTTPELITVNLGTGGTVGGYKTGDTIAAGTDFQTILNKLFKKSFPATIELANNGGTAAGNIEVGSTVTPKLKATFTQNDAGNLTLISIKQGTEVKATGASSPLTYTGDSMVIGDETLTFKATADYGDASASNDPLLAGTIESNSYSIAGKRKAFYGAGTGALPELTSDVIRGLSGAKLAPAQGTSFEIKVAVGQQHIIFAYPSSLRDVNNVTYVEMNDSGMAPNFTKHEVSVADIRGGSNGLMTYKVYTYAMIVPAAASMTFKVTI